MKPSTSRSTDSTQGQLIVPEVGGGASAPAALFVHGWGGSQAESLAAACAVAALGFICLIFDLRGHAGTLSLRDTVTREENLRDVVTAYDVLANRVGVDRSRILLAGSSYGAYLGAIATGLRPLRWLSMQGPAIYKDAGWNLPKCELHCDPDFEEFLCRAHRPADNRALEAGERFRGDVLLVESGNDRTMPHPVVASYVVRHSPTRIRSPTGSSKVPTMASPERRGGRLTSSPLSAGSRRRRQALLWASRAAAAGTHAGSGVDQRLRITSRGSFVPVGRNEPECRRRSSGVHSANSSYPTSSGFTQRHSAIFAATSPSPQRPLFASAARWCAGDVVRKLELARESDAQTKLTVIVDGLRR